MDTILDEVPRGISRKERTGEVLSMTCVAAVKTDGASYPEVAPFSPSEAYPEYPFPGCLSVSVNPVYAGVRRLFLTLGLDAEHYGAKEWNPLQRIVFPGTRVVIKPNFVLSSHRGRKNVFAIITHPSVLRAIADYVWIALRGEGDIIIADSPQYDCNWEELMEATQLPRVAEFYNAFPGPRVSLRDLRSYWSSWKHFPSLLKPLPGDPEGNLLVNLGTRSKLYKKPHPHKLYGAVYNRGETIAHHMGGRHEYQIARTIMNADTVISVPKLKVHKKVGVTLNVKGLVGINTNKNYLVHYSLTPPRAGGDQYPDDLFTPIEEMLIRMERWMYDYLLAPRVRALEYLHRSIYWLHNHTTKRLGLKVEEHKRLLDAGNWHGNDSAWRMAVDLLRVFLFSDRDGNLHSTPQRRVFSLVDGVIGGDLNGPLTPDPVPSGVLIGGENLVAVDLVATRLMGFDPRKIKMFKGILGDPDFDCGVASLDEINVLSPEMGLKKCLHNSEAYLKFKPHPGWVGHIEI